MEFTLYNIIGGISAVISISSFIFLLWMMIFGIPWETHERRPTKRKKGKKNG